MDETARIRRPQRRRNRESDTLLRICPLRDKEEQNEMPHRNIRNELATKHLEKREMNQYTKGTRMIDIAKVANNFSYGG